MRTFALLAGLTLIAAGCNVATAPNDKPSLDAISGCDAGAHAACTGTNPSKHNP